MVAGSPGRQVDTAPWRRALLVWMLIILAETAHGMARELFIAPAIGDLRARQVGVLIGSVIVLGVAWLTARWLDARTRRLQFAIGALWVALTLTFEMLVGRAIGASWERIISDFNPARGGFMLAGLAILFLAPWFTARLWHRFREPFLITKPGMITHQGGCHCGRVRFEVDAPAELLVDECNCSMCGRFGYLHLIVPSARFRLLKGRDALTTYTFNTATAKHHFCATCGVKSFYVPRSHPDGFSVNARCIDSPTITGMKISHVDGRNWEQHYPAGRGEYTA